MNLDRIKKNIDIIDECWIWNRSCTQDGYGQLTESRKYWKTHRYAYTCVNGNIPDGLLIRHSCHNPKCCNPDHLLTGTNLDNYNDSKETHKIAAKQRRKKWNINNVSYGTLREAVQETGITPQTIIKHTKDGIFNISNYRNNCYIARVTPKI